MYKKLIFPIFTRIDPEKLQIRIKKFLHLSESNSFFLFFLQTLAYKRKRFTDRLLQVQLAGITFDNPVLVAAGWDKYGECVKALYTLGFSGVEVGSVVTYPQPGNPKPRLFMIGPGVVLNHFGFNSPGIETVAKNLAPYIGSGIPIGINIGKNKYIPNDSAAQLYTIAIRRFYECASYFVINVSSPNTKNLKDLQEKKVLTKVIHQVIQVMEQIGGRKPLFIKIAPDISQNFLDNVIEVALKNKLTGIVATNTTTNRHLKAKYGHDWEERQGGVSGDDPHFRKIANAQVAYIYTKSKRRLKIIGVGGIKDAQTAIEKIKAGASIVQVMSAIYSEGLTLPGKINEGILEYMKKEKIKSLADLVGADAKKWKLY